MRSSEGMRRWLTLLFGIAANGLSEHMPYLCKRLFMQLLGKFPYLGRVMGDRKAVCVSLVLIITISPGVIRFAISKV